MSNLIKVTKIEIKIGDKILSLTPDELKELKDILNKTFPDEVVRWIPSQPIYIPTPVSPLIPYYGDPPWTITCGNMKSDGNSTLFLNKNE